MPQMAPMNWIWMSINIIMIIIVLMTMIHFSLKNSLMNSKKTHNHMNWLWKW